MAAHYKRGQKVVIVPAKNKNLPQWDSKLEPFVGRSGVITDYYWIDVPEGDEEVYIYTIKMKEENREVVVYEDEIKACVD